MKKNKYTVIYSHYFQIGSHSNSLTSYKHIEGESVVSAILSSDIDLTQVWFVFDGWSELSEGWINPNGK